MLRHKRLGHLSLSKICKALKEKTIHDVPLLKQTTGIFFAECLAGKQTKTSQDK